MKERRSLKRFNLEIPMLIAGDDGKGNLFEEKTSSRDISSGGAWCFIRNHMNVEENSEVFITLFLPIRERKSQARIKGTVVRVEEEDEGDNLRGAAFCFEPETVLRF